jgi:predicted acylesterase/phospholipase RssA
MPQDAFEKLKGQLKNITKPLLGSEDKIAVCLAGGGITGSMYEVGCLAALDEFFEPPFSVKEMDIFVGTSAGAIVSALVANGYTPQELFDGISHDSDAALNFKRKNIYNLRWGEVFKGFLPLIKRLPSLVRYGWINRRQATFMDLISIMQEFIPSGIFSLNNLDKFLTGVLYPEGKTNDFRNLKKELYIPATELDSGERWVFGEEGADDVPISKAVAASAAIPIFFRPLRINDRDFIDGSTSKVSHMDIALKHGAKLIIIINPTTPIVNDLTRLCLPTFDGTCGRIAQKGMSMISEQARRIETKTRFELGFERFKREHPEVDFIIIQPEPSDTILYLHGVMDFDSRQQIMDYGYNSVKAYMEKDFESLREVFAKHKIGLRHPETKKGQHRKRVLASP